MTCDQVWFLEQVRREQTRLRAFVRSLGVRPEAVDDLAQDALVIALEKLGDFDRSRGDFGGWVRQIAKNLVANDRRKEMRRARLLSVHVTDVLAAMGEDVPGPAEAQERKEELAALRECLAEMPGRGRDLLYQRYFEGLSPGAIAARLGQPSNRVRQTLLRLRRLLMDCVERRVGMVSP